MATMATETQQTQSSKANGAVVTARGVTRVYGEGDTAVNALRGVDLDVERGKLTGVMGPSGSGKSTLMHILAGLDKPTEGDVAIDGTSIEDLSDTELTKLRRQHIGFVFQFFNLLPMLTAEENIVLPLELGGTKMDKDWNESVIERVGLADRRKHRPAELSGGQQQRVAIARALDQQADGRLRGRADGQPRLDHEPGDPRPPAGVGRDPRPDVRHGLARSEGDRDRRPHALPRRRPHRQGAAAGRPRMRSSRRWRR